MDSVGTQGRSARQSADHGTELPLLLFDQIAPILDANDFVQGLLLPESTIVVYGPSNCGKTFWVLDLALHVAAGWEWNKRRVRQTGVIYCVLEGGIGLRNRVAGWKQHHEVAGTLPFAVVPAQLNLLDPTADTDALIATIQSGASQMGFRVGLVVIDTLARALAGGNENNPDDMGCLVMNVDRIRAETGAAVVLIHHSGKDQARGARGHSSLQAAVDTEIEINLDASSDFRTAKVTKQRDLPKGDTLRFMLQPVELGTNSYGDIVTTCVVDTKGLRGSNSEVSLSGDAKRAFDVLANLVVKEGVPGCPVLPHNIPSVPEKRWREEFFDRAKPGAGDAAKRKAFQRAADTLVNRNLVGMGAKRVWLVFRNEGQDVP